jgi:hypothetical protein
VWFGNVERVASEWIGRETVTYVSNTYKYYITTVCSALNGIDAKRRRLRFRSATDRGIHGRGSRVRRDP